MEYIIVGRLYYVDAATRNARLTTYTNLASGLARRGGTLDLLFALDDSSHKYSAANFAIETEMHFLNRADRESIWANIAAANDAAVQLGSFMRAEDNDEVADINSIAHERHW